MWDKTNETDLGRRVAALESQTVDLRRRVAELASRVPVLSEEIVQCEDEKSCMYTCSFGGDCHREPHVRRSDCHEPCKYTRALCIPVPASPEVAIPDQITIDSMAHLEPEVAIPATPEPVGTEAFRRELTGHMQTLAQAYSWDADSLPVWGGHDYLERLAGVACAIRDAYELARTGEHEAAQEKLEEIRW